MQTVGAERDGVTRKTAEAALRDRLVKVEQRGWRKPAPLTFKTYAARWFEQSELRRGWKPKTAATHRQRLVHLVDYFGKVKLDSIRPSNITAYIAESLDNRSARTVIAEVNLLHDVLGRAVVEELIPSNPVTGVERPKAKPNRWRIADQAVPRRQARRAHAPRADPGGIGARPHGDCRTPLVPDDAEVLHLAGRSFPTAAAALEDRLLAGGLSTEPSTDLTASEPVSAGPGASETA